MPISDFTSYVGKQYVTISTVDPRTRQVEGMLKDGTPIAISVEDTPPFFRWPNEGETWAVRYNGIAPVLAEYVENPEATLPVETIQPGESRIDSSKVHFSGGANFVLSPTAPTPVSFANDTRVATTAFVQGAAGTVNAALAAHAADTTGIHGIADTSQLALLADLVPLATDADLTAHAADTTGIHGITDTANLVYTDDSRLSDSRPPIGPAGGVLGGTYPNPTFAVDMATQSELDTHAADTTAIHGITDTANLVYTSDSRLSDSRPPTGPAGGVLSGNYPDPGFAVDMATQGELDTHIADTTAIHGIADTSLLLKSGDAAGGVLAGTYPNPSFAVDMATQAELDAFSASVAAGYQPLNSNLTAISGNATNGLYARTGAGTLAARTIAGTTGQITVTNGDGVAGDPTISLPANITQATQFSSTSGLTVDPGSGTNSAILSLVGRNAGAANAGGIFISSSGSLYLDATSGSAIVGRTGGANRFVSDSTGFDIPSGTLYKINGTQISSAALSDSASIAHVNAVETITSSWDFQSTSRWASAGTSGDVRMVPGNSTNMGYVQWTRQDGATRAAYMGFGNSGPALVLENGSPFHVQTSSQGHGLLTSEVATLMVSNSNLTFNGNVANQRGTIFNAPTYVGTGGARTITTAATLTIGGAPVAGASMTLTDSYALDVTGRVRFVQSAGNSSYVADGVWDASAKPTTFSSLGNGALRIGYNDGGQGEYVPSLGFGGANVTSQVYNSRVILQTRVNIAGTGGGADTANRFQTTFNGTFGWGVGSSALDTFLARTASGTLDLTTTGDSNAVLNLVASGTGAPVLSLNGNGTNIINFNDGDAATDQKRFRFTNSNGTFALQWVNDAYSNARDLHMQSQTGLITIKSNEASQKSLTLQPNEAAVTTPGLRVSDGGTGLVVSGAPVRIGWDNSNGAIYFGASSGNLLGFYGNTARARNSTAFTNNSGLAAATYDLPAGFTIHDLAKYVLTILRHLGSANGTGMLATTSI